MKNHLHIETIEEEFTKISVAGKGLRDSTFARFPILFSLLTTFGLVATLYGFEKVIDQIVFFNVYPEVLFLIGVATLTLTGTLYKKLR